MTHHEGDLVVTAENARYASTLTSVGGWLEIDAEGAALPALTSVGGALDICAEGVALPALERVGETLYIRAEGAALPALTSVGGALYIYAKGAALPVLTTVNGHPWADPDPAEAKALWREVFHAVEAETIGLEMGNWHAKGRCGTTHCIAGAAIHLRGEEGYALEDAYGSASTAGLALLGLDAGPIFYMGEDKAMEELRRRAAAPAESEQTAR